MKKALLKVGGVILIVWGSCWIVSFCLVYVVKYLLHDVLHDASFVARSVVATIRSILTLGGMSTQDILLFRGRSISLVIAWLRFLLFLSSPILIFSGIKLFSFNKLSRKLAIFSYSIVLLYVAFMNVFMYFIMMSISNSRYDLFSIESIKQYFSGFWVFPGYAIKMITLTLIPIFFIVTLVKSKEQFE